MMLGYSDKLSSSFAFTDYENAAISRERISPRMVHPSGLEPEPRASELAKFSTIFCKAHYIVLFLLFYFHILYIAFIISTPFNNFYGVRVYIGCKFSGCIFMH